MITDLRLEFAALRVRVAEMEERNTRMEAMLERVIEALSSESVINAIRQERRHRQEKDYHYRAIADLQRCLGTATIPATITAIERVFTGARAIPPGAEVYVAALRVKYGNAGPGESTIRRALPKFSNG